MLHHLVAYAENRLDSEPGFTTREVRWQVELDSNGILVGVIPLGDGRRGQRLPRCPEMRHERRWTRPFPSRIGTDRCIDV